MSKWVVEAISLAYESASQTSHMAVRSHSTRNMVDSKALISGVALQEVCDVAGWSSPHTFIRLYSLDLENERCVPGHISFVPVSNVLRIFKIVTASFGQAL